MAGISEIAIGLATVLTSSSEPEPFPVTLRGQSLADAALLVRAIIRECADAGLLLHRVEVPAELMRHMRDGHLPDGSYSGVQLVEAADLGTELRFYRTGQTSTSVTGRALRFSLRKIRWAKFIVIPQRGRSSLDSKLFLRVQSF